MQDRCENTDRKSKDNKRSTEKGRGYIRSIRTACSHGSLRSLVPASAYTTEHSTLHCLSWFSWSLSIPL